MEERTIEIEADSLEEARLKLKPQIPKGFRVHVEKVISDGKPHSVSASGDTLEAAWKQTKSEIPPGADILKQKETPSEEKVTKTTIEAFGEQEARTRAEVKARPLSTNRVTVQSVRLVLAGEKGFMGIGKKPGQYEVELCEHLPAKVEVTYKGKAKISATVRKYEQGEIACPRCGLTFVPARIYIMSQDIVNRFGPNPVQCPNCKHIWNRG